MLSDCEKGGSRPYRTACEAPDGATRARLRARAASRYLLDPLALLARPPPLLTQLLNAAAHGFQVLEAGSELLYLHTAFYKPESEGGLRHDDAELGIAWPLPVTDISARDSSHAYIDSCFKGIVL